MTMNSYELMDKNSYHMFGSDQLLASDSNEDSNDEHSSDKYHSLGPLGFNDMDLENNLYIGHNNGLTEHNGHTGHTPEGQHSNAQNITLNSNQSNCMNNKRKSIETNGVVNGGPPKRMPPPNGKKTKGRVKIKMEFIDNKLRRYTTFSKRKTGIMKKAYELSTLTGTQVMLLVASETGHVYTFATRKLQPMITSDAGKALIQTCLNSPDPNAGIGCGDQRMSATGFEETDLTYAVGEESPNDKSDESCEPTANCPSSGDSSEENGMESPELLTSGPTGVHTFAQLENALPMNYLTEAHLISNKLISHLANNNVLTTTPSSVPHTTQCSSTGASSQVQSNSNSQKLGTNKCNSSQTIHSLPSMSHTSAQHLLGAGNILLCANGTQLSLPGGQSSTQSSPSTTTATLMYNPTQGVMYATAGAPGDGLIFNLGQNHSTGTEFLINNTISQLQLQQQPKPMTANTTQTAAAGAKRQESSSSKKQRIKQ